MTRTSSETTWEATRAARLALADALEGVDPASWDAPSWCSQWRVRDVVGHVTANGEGAFVLHRVLPGLARHHLAVDAFLLADGRRRGAAEPAVLISRLRQAAGGRFHPPGRTPADVLGDVLVHTQDAVRPIGIACRPPNHALRIALSRIAPSKSPPSKNRAAGIRLRARDLDWTWGTGPEVAGPALDLLLAVTGRAAALASLTGPGVSVLAARQPALTSAPAAGAGDRRPAI
jgi:uncharacterized protein (TIGR03083 family)